MKEQQKQACSCHVCGRKRIVIEEELEMLYNAYYDELESFSNSKNPTDIQPRKNSKKLHRLEAAQKTPVLVVDPIEDDGDEMYEDISDSESVAFYPSSSYPYADYEETLSDEDDSDSEEDEISRGIKEFGTSLTVKPGGILTVADDFLKNDGQKFLDLMEQLAQRKMIDNNSEWAPEIDSDNDSDSYDESNSSSSTDYPSSHHRMAEGRRMFQIFAARMFEQRVLQAYKAKLAQDKRDALLAELEREDLQKKENEIKKREANERKKKQKLLLKQQKEREQKIQQEKAEQEKLDKKVKERERERYEKH